MAEKIFATAHEELMLERIFPEELEPMKRIHTGAGERCEEEGTTERQPLCTDCNLPCSTQGATEESEVKE